jgi:hypothetical protein
MGDELWSPGAEATSGEEVMIGEGSRAAGPLVGGEDWSGELRVTE